MKKFFLILVLSRLSLGWTHVGSNILGWSNHKVTVHVNPTNCSIPETDLYTIIDQSINAWNSLPITDLELVRDQTASTTTVDQLLASTATDVPLIVCDTNMTGHGLEADYIPASTVKIQLSEAGNISYAGILLNAENGAGANLRELTQGEVAVTLAHEIGHALGLGHTSQPQALMYYSIDDKTKPTITEDDMDGIAHLYPRNELKAGQFGCSAVHAVGNRRFGWLEMFLILVGFAIANISVGRKLKKKSIKPERLP